MSRLSAVRFLGGAAQFLRAQITRIRPLSSSPTLVAGCSFDCPASPEKRRPTRCRFPRRVDS
ncbi:MAG: hypothetical protein ACK56F_01990, partial [bacterium]